MDECRVILADVLVKLFEVEFRFLDRRELLNILFVFSKFLVSVLNNFLAVKVDVLWS
jgi:hypothetical protein